MPSTPLAATAALLFLSACSAGTGGPATGNSDAPDMAAPAQDGQRAGPFNVATVADLDAPWAMTFLPDGHLLITEKAGGMVLLSQDGRTRIAVEGFPAVDAAGQGGMQDVALHPQFASNNQVYFSFTEAGQGGKGVVLARGTLVRDGDAARITDVRTLYRATPYVEGNGHYSGQIAFSPDGRYVFFGMGERQKFDPAQDNAGTLGKIARLTLDGQPAPGNPLAAQGFRPEIWSYGHRNILGMAFDSAGNFWQQEMGPKAGDELNLVLPGRNYGYPMVSDGDHYDGRPIPDHSTRPDLEAPKVSWMGTAISPAGLMIYSGDMFPEWRGDAFIGALSGQALVRVDIDGTGATKGDQWGMGTRIRDVAQAPDGAIWVIEDGGRGAQGRVMRLTRAR